MPTTRRTFAKAGAAAAFALTAAQTQNVLGANDRIRLGFIGVANRGGQLLDAFLDHKDMEVAVLCDVSQSTLDTRTERLMTERCGNSWVFAVVGPTGLAAATVDLGEHKPCLHRFLG